MPRIFWIGSGTLSPRSMEANSTPASRSTSLLRFATGSNSHAWGFGPSPQVRDLLPSVDGPGFLCSVRLVVRLGNFYDVLGFPERESGGSAGSIAADRRQRDSIIT